MGKGAATGLKVMGAGVVAAAVLVTGSLAAAKEGPNTAAADSALDRALVRFVESEGGPPGIVAAIQRGSGIRLHTAGVRKVEGVPPIREGDHLRVASVAKAFSSATALSLVADGLLSLRSSIGEVLPGLPSQWWNVTLRQLLRHTSGIPDFSLTEGFREALFASLTDPPPPAQLLSYIADEPLLFAPGSTYQYSNSDNIVVGLMVQAVTGRNYRRELRERVSQPLGMGRTDLPRGTGLPSPAVHGYQPDPPAQPEDVTEVVAAGWSWASGGVTSTPRDMTRFVRGYARGATTDAATRRAQFRFVDGHSEPTGPGVNSAGLGIFRYETKCGTVFGHTGNTPGYTNFIAASRNGGRSATVTINSQVTPKTDPERFRDLRQIFRLAVCAAMAGRG